MPKLFISLLLTAACVFIHAAGLAIALDWLKRRSLPHLGASVIYVVGWLIAIAAWTILLHLSEILIWAIAYVGYGVMPDLVTATYFSAVTYTTTGYGDLVLPPGWRLMGGVEALTGILMSGLSTGLFFALFAKVVESAPKASSANGH